MAKSYVTKEFEKGTFLCEAWNAMDYTEAVVEITKAGGEIDLETVHRSVMDGYCSFKYKMVEKPVEKPKQKQKKKTPAPKKTED